MKAKRRRDEKKSLIKLIFGKNVGRNRNRWSVVSLYSRNDNLPSTAEDVEGDSKREEREKEG